MWIGSLCSAARWLKAALLLVDWLSFSLISCCCISSNNALVPAFSGRSLAGRLSVPPCPDRFALHPDAADAVAGCRRRGPGGGTATHGEPLAHFCESLPGEGPAAVIPLGSAAIQDEAQGYFSPAGDDPALQPAPRPRRPVGHVGPPAARPELHAGLVQELHGVLRSARPSTPSADGAWPVRRTPAEFQGRSGRDLPRTSGIEDVPRRAADLPHRDPR